jgi:CBS domain containing-hemolysin-like protein
MSVFKKLEPLFATTIKEIQRPATVHVLSLRSPAMEVFTDFSMQQPLMLEHVTSIDDAREIMKSTHNKFFLVIDKQESFLGVVSLEDLESEKVMAEIARSRLRRHELTVEKVMTPPCHICSIDFRDFQQADIGCVLACMKDYGEQYVLVVDAQRSSIRGIVSAETIARRMHSPVVISERAVSFSDIFKTIAR